MRYWLPALFWNDHRDRLLPSGTLIRESGKRVLVEMDDFERAEIINDADYYSDAEGWQDAPAMRRLARSARATVKALSAQPLPLSTSEDICKALAIGDD